ncbi:hypothetical protein BGW80DRAFT_1344183 [Lactifluus volemus]|nr:hypothetical protein BGW80DRAFT_1344183 [Lactifluus volemus]
MAFAQRHGPHNPSWVAAFMNFMIAVPCLTLAANVVATTLVLWRICTYYFTVKKLERFEGGPDVQEMHGGAQYYRLLIIIIESGGMYCLTWLLLLSFEFAGSPAVHICLSIIGQLTGIYPTLIIVLVSLNLTQDNVQVLNDTGIEFGRGTMRLSTFSRTVNFTSTHDSHGLNGSSSGGDCDTGIAITTEDGGQCVTDIT